MAEREADFDGDVPSQESITVAEQAAGDDDLIRKFLAGDQAAFAELVARHGSLVMATCRRMLADERDAEDAFQATFVALAQRAADTEWQPTIAGWLHETARRSAAKLRGRAARRQLVEGSDEGEVAGEAASPAPPPSESAALAELSAILDEELERLPERFRETILLTQLAGLDRAAAAGRLGISVAAVKDRLERGRDLLRSRLLARGVTFSAAILAAWLAAGTASAAVPAALAASTLGAAGAAAGVGAAALTPSVTTLLQGIWNMTLFDKLKAGAICLVSLLTAGTVVYAMIQDAPNRFEEGLRGRVLATAVAGSRPTITIDVDEHPVKLNLDVAADVKVYVAYEAAALADVRPGTWVSLRMADDLRTVKEIHARGHVRQVAVGTSGGVALSGRTIEDDDDGPVGPPIDYALAPGAVVRIGGLPASLDEIRPGMDVPLELAKDGKTINAIEAEGRRELMHHGPLLEVDAVNRVVKARLEIDDVDVEQLFHVAADAIIVVDGKAGKLEDLKPGARIAFRLGDDEKTIRAIQGQNRGKEEDDD